MRKNQKGFSLGLILIIILVLGLIFLLMKKGIIPQQTAGVPAIQTRTDLDAASKELNNTDLNQIDSGIVQMNSEASF